MKFKRTLSTHISLFILPAFVAIQTVHAEYGVNKLTAHLKEKTENIQAEYQKLRNENPLQYLWKTYTCRPHNLYLTFFGTNVVSAEDIKRQTETLFLFEDPNLRKRLLAFISVFTSENFLRMLFSDDVIRQLVCFDTEKCASFWWDTEPSETPSEFRIFSVRVKHVLFEEMDFFLERRKTLLDITLVFAYDIQNDTVRFIGVKDKSIVNVKYADDMNLPIYARANAEQQNDLMCID